MGFVRDLTGSSAKKAASRAAGKQEAMGREAIELQRETRDLMREDLAPFRDIYTPEIGQQLTGLATQGADFSGIQALQPFDPMQDQSFRALADEASRRVFSNQAARGKLGSGGTAEALQNQLVGLGEGMRAQRAAEQAQQFGQQMQLATVPQQQQFNQLMNLAGIGQSAAAGQASAAGTAGTNISELLTGIGNAQAAGLVGGAQAKSQALGGLMQLAGMGAAMSDIRAKENIKPVGDINGIPWFTFDYIDGEKNQQGTMAQLIQDDYPDAVVEIDGMLHVDYGKLPIWQ